MRLRRFMLQVQKLVERHKHSFEPIRCCLLDMRDRHEAAVSSKQLLDPSPTSWPLLATRGNPACLWSALALTGSFAERRSPRRVSSGSERNWLCRGECFTIEYRIVNNERDQLLMLAGKLANRR
jgi:hypothetical protein